MPPSRAPSATDAAVVAETVTVKDDSGNAGLLGALGNGLADFFGGVGLFLALQRVTDALVDRRRLSEGGALAVVDELSIDVAGAAEHGQAGALGEAFHALADPELTLDARRFLVVFAAQGGEVDLSHKN